MLEIVTKAHSGLRWLILTVAVIGIARAAWAWLVSREHRTFDRLLSAVYAGLLDLQILLGVVIFFLHETFGRPTLWHPILMVLAAVSAHVGTVVARRTGKEQQKQYAQLVMYSLSLLLILLGARVIGVPFF